MTTGVVKHDPFLMHDINVRAFGAVGDGVADDTEPFREAIAAASEFNGTVFVPAATRYRITDELLLDGNIPSIVGEGLGSRIAFDQGGFRRPPQAGAGGYQLGGFDRLRIDTNDDAWAIEVRDTVCGFHLRDVLTSGKNGIRLDHTFDWFASNVSCRGGQSADGIGFVAANHGVLNGYNASNFDIGLLLDGMGISIGEFRIEVCNVGVSVGTEGLGSLYATSLSGFTLESCVTGIYVNSASYVTISDGQILGYQTAPFFSDHAIDVKSMSYSTIRNVRCTGSYNRGVVRWRAPRGETCNIEGIQCDDQNAAPFDMSGSLPNISRSNRSDFDPSAISRSGVATVSPGETEAVLPFDTIATVGQCVQNGNPTSIPGNLPAGVYEYGTAVVDALGILPTSLDSTSKVATVTEGGARVAWFNMSPGVERRIYRRAADEDWWGYFVQPDSGKTFDDIGQPFDGFGCVPVAGATRPAYHGADTGYSITLMPEFSAGVWLKERRTDCVVIGLSAGHPGGVIRWSLTR